jgi:hypothetical protein
MAKYSWLVSLLAAATCAAACSSDTPAGTGNKCAPGDTAACTCSGGREGVRTCRSDRTYGPCDCTGGEGGSGGTGGFGGDGGSGGTVERALRCTPEELDFGRVVRGDQRELSITCTNDSNVAETLVVGRITGNGAESFSHRYGEGASVSLPAGHNVDIRVQFAALRTGPAEARLPLEKGNGDEVAQIRLVGAAVDHAVSCGPNAAFGDVAPGTSVERTIVCRNDASRTYAVTELSWTLGSDPRFSLGDLPSPAEIPPGDQIEIEVRFSPYPEDTGELHLARLAIATDDPGAPRFVVELSGYSGVPLLSCDPHVEFGVVSVNVPAVRSLSCENVGHRPLQVEGVEIDSSEFTAAVRGGIRPGGYGAGATFLVDVTYQPTDEGVDTATLRVRSNSFDSENSSVELTGFGRDIPPCELTIAPEELRFGNVDVGRSATLEVALRNRRSDAECLVVDLRLAPGCDPSYSLPYGESELYVLPMGGELRYPVRFEPLAYREEPYTCELTFDVTDSQNPHRSVPIHGVSREPCLDLQPDEVDFGPVQANCTPRRREVRVVNRCDTPLTIDAVTLGDGPSDEFHLLAAPPPGTTLPPFGSTPILLSYEPTDQGPDTGSLYVSVAGTAEPYLAILEGEESAGGVGLERFLSESPKVDVLWVMDNSVTMGPLQEAFATNVASFLSSAGPVDFQIGVTTTGLIPSPTPTDPANACPGGVDGGEDGRLFPVDGSRPRILTPATPGLEATLAANLRVGLCHYEEQAFEAALRAISPPLIVRCDDPRHPEPNDGNCGFLRRDAVLSLVFVSDEAEGSPQMIGHYENAFRALKGFENPDLLRVHAFSDDDCPVPTSNDDRYRILAQATGGSIHSSCPADFSGMLRELSRAVFRVETCFFLGGHPGDQNGDGSISDPDELSVRLDGQIVPSTGSGGEAIWHYDAGRNAICFEPDSTPVQGTDVEIAYRVACNAP